MKRVIFTRAVCAVAAFTTGSAALAASTFSAGLSQGVVNTPQIDEASGLVASRNNAGVLWTHNDSGDANRIFAIDTAGKLLGTYTLPGATNADWEEMSIGPGPVPGVSYLYLMESNESADPGRVYRIPEPAVYAAKQAITPVMSSIVGVESKKFSFPEADSEAMFVDPVDGGIYLGSKESGRIDFYRGTQADFASAGATTLSTPAASIAGLISRANGASISPSGGEILVRFGGQFALLYTRSPGQTIAQALANPSPQFAPVNGQDIEPNSEAIAFDAIGKDYFTISEGVNQHLYRYERTSNDGPPQPQSLVSAGATWRYVSGGANAGNGWQNAGFDDSAWASDEGPFGYGNGDEQTVIPFGPSANEKAAAAFFRTTFSLADASSIEELTLKLLVDDGAAVYLNGIEISRDNLAAGAGANEFALSALSDALENTWRTMLIDPSLLVSGVNTLAVEVHGSGATDADLRFDLQLQSIASVPEPASASLAVMVPGALIMSWRRIRS